MCSGQEGNIKLTLGKCQNNHGYKQGPPIDTKISVLAKYDVLSHSIYYKIFINFKKNKQ